MGMRCAGRDVRDALLGSSITKLDRLTLQEPDSPHSKRLRRSLDDGCGPASITQLPSELLLRVLSFLSAEDLTATVAPTCRAFKAAADDAASWRRLFAVRWGGAQGSTSSTDGSSLPWKVRSVIDML